MNVVPLFPDRKQALKIWRETIHWWHDTTIKLRFIESTDQYWLVLAGESKRPEGNRSFFKLLPKSENYERFKLGHGETAYLRVGVYSTQYKNDVKFDAVCNCGHIMEDHEEETDKDACLIEECNCKKFESFQVNLLKKKKTITDIKFLTEQNVKSDALSWNCLYTNKFKIKPDEN